MPHRRSEARAGVYLDGRYKVELGAQSMGKLGALQETKLAEGTGRVAPALAANVIPKVARATLDLRLVPGSDWARQAARLVAHIKAQGWHVLDRDSTDEERARRIMKT